MHHPESTMLARSLRKFPRTAVQHIECTRSQLQVLRLGEIYVFVCGQVPRPETGRAEAVPAYVRYDPISRDDVSVVRVHRSVAEGRIVAKWRRVISITPIKRVSR